MKKKIILLLFIIVISAIINLGATKKDKAKIIFSPLAFYTPETRIAYGAAGSVIFHSTDNNSETRPSSISPLMIFTQEKQFKALVNAGIYFKENNYRVEAEIKFEKFPNKFFGIGPNTQEDAKEAYTPKSVSFQISAYKKLLKGFNVGIGYHFMDWVIIDTQEGGQLENGIIPGSESGTISGVRLLLERDTRDHIFFPMKGDLFKFDARFYSEFIGSTYNFSSFTLDLRKYFTLFSSHVLAFQSLIKFQSGTVPFLQLAQIGGQYTMRGYFEGRFRDKNLYAFQFEYRSPLIWRFGLVGFVGFANVAKEFYQLKIQDLRNSYGFGIRYLFSKKEKIQVRFDVGFGEGNTGFYASIYEAF